MHYASFREGSRKDSDSIQAFLLDWVHHEWLASPSLRLAKMSCLPFLVLVVLDVFVAASSRWWQLKYFLFPSRTIGK